MTNPKTADLRTVGYARVSTKEQAVDSQALEQQKARLREEGKADEILTDVLSGSRSDRPNFNRLMELVKNQEIGEVVCTRIDRLGRSLIDLTQCIEVFQDCGVNLRILDQSIDLSTPTGRLMANLLGALAQWETDLLSERVRHGKAYRRQQGLASESAPRAYLSEGGSYQLNQAPILCLIEERPDDFRKLARIEDDNSDELAALTVADIAQNLVDIFLEKKTTRATLQQFYQRYGIRRRSSRGRKTDSAQPADMPPENVVSDHKVSEEKDWPAHILYWTESGLRNWLTNSVLEGNTVYLKWKSQGNRRVRSKEDPDVHADTHPDQTLMTHEEANYIRETFRITKQMGGGSFIKQRDDAALQYRPYAYLNGLAYCHECGAKCRTKTSKQGAYTYFTCPHAGKGCDNRKSIAKDALEKDLIRYLVRTSKRLREQATDVNSRLLGVKGLIMDLRGASQEEKRQFSLDNQPKYTDLLAPDREDSRTSERLQKLQVQLRYLEDSPYSSANLEAEKVSVLEQIEEEKQQLNSILNKSAGEIIFEGYRVNFWDTLSDQNKVEIYPRIVQRLYLNRAGELEQVNLKMEPLDKETD